MAANTVSIEDPFKQNLINEDGDAVHGFFLMPFWAEFDRYRW